LGAFKIYLKLEDVKIPQKVGGEGFSNQPKMKLKSKLNSLIIEKEVRNVVKR